MEAKELLEQIKNNNISYAILSKEGDVYCNEGTDNIMDVYGYIEDEEHFYGVYGDIVDGQIDSRIYPDDIILKAIEFVINHGDIVKRSELKTGDDFKIAYFEKEPFDVEFASFDIVKYEKWISDHKNELVGTTVEHSTFGKGRIVEVESIDNPKRGSIRVEFENGKNKELHLATLIEKNLLK